MQDEAAKLGIPYANLQRVSLTSQWIARWDAIEQIGSSLGWRTEVRDDWGRSTVPVGPKDIAEVFGWKTAIFSTCVQTGVSRGIKLTVPLLSGTGSSTRSLPPCSRRRTCAR